MKKALFLICALCSIPAMAQDVIIKQNGDEIQCKLLEVGTESVKYKRWTNQNGPTFVEEREEIFMIKYQNGEKDVFGVKPTPQSNIVTDKSQIITIPNLKYDKEYESGLSLGGMALSVEQAQSIMGDDWNEFTMYKEKRKKGKRLLILGGICRAMSVGTMIAGLYGGEPPLLIVTGGLRLTSTPLFALGIVNLVKSQHGCNQLVEKHNSRTTGFNSQIDLGIGINTLSLRMSF